MLSRHSFIQCLVTSKIRWGFVAKTLAVILTGVLGAWPVSDALGISVAQAEPSAPVRDRDPALSRGLYTPRPANERGCSAVDLRRRLPPVRNQGQRGFCFAFAAADLLSERLGIPGGVSAYQVTANYFLNGIDRSSSRRFGPDFEQHFYRPQQSTLHSQERLREVDVRRMMASHGEQGFDSVSNGYVRRALADFSNANRVCSERDLPYDAAIDAQGTDRVLAAARQRSAQESHRCDGIGQPLINNANNLYIALNLEAVGVVREIEGRCQSQRPATPIIPQGFDSNWPSKDERSSRAIHRALDLRRPAAITIDMRSWMNPVPEQHSFHAMVVTGREWDARTNSCRIRIRNSWGASCAYPYGPRVRCDSDGTLLVDEALLNETVQSVDYIP